MPLLAPVFNHGKTVPGGGCSSRSPPTQDSFVHQHLGYDLREHIILEDILAASLPLPIITAPIATVPSPTPQPHSPSVRLLLLLPEQPVANLFPNLFHAPVCTFAIDCYPRQYTIVYDHGEKFWVPQEEFIE